MQQSCTYGSVRGASGNWRPYRDKRVLEGRKEPKSANARTWNQQLAAPRKSILTKEKGFSATC
jgi:hypothetical protein